MGGRMASGMASGMGSQMEEKSKLLQMIEELPFWAQSLISIAVVMILAAVVGMIIGKLYAMVKYPDPEKHSVVSPKIKVAFIVLLAVCCWWLFSTMMEENKPKDDIAGDTPAAMGHQPDTMMGGVQGGIAW